MAYLVEYKISQEAAQRQFGPGRDDLVNAALSWWPLMVETIEYEAQKAATFLHFRCGLIEDTRVTEIPDDRKVNCDAGPVWWWNWD